LAVASTLIDLAWYVGIVRLVGAAERFFKRPAVRRCMEYISGTLLIGLAVRLALTNKP
jgi:threonine/homoserine/homoserine lactone efflux protein